MLERRCIIFYGKVQGVGFRAGASRLAQGQPLAGFVRNLPNGSVELAVEGETAAVDAYLARLAERMVGKIERMEVQAQPPLGSSGFSVR